MIFVHSTSDRKMVMTPSRACLRMRCSEPNPAYLAVIFESPTGDMDDSCAVCAAMKVASLESVEPSSALDCSGK
jgi:hypothetical protein